MKIAVVMNKSQTKLSRPPTRCQPAT